MKTLRVMMMWLFGAKSLRELLALARAKPGYLNKDAGIRLD